MNLFKMIYRNILRMMPTRLALYLIYFRGYKKILNLKNPKYWGEKIQWLKLYGGLEELSRYVDKYEVRKYVTHTIGKEYLSRVIGIYNNVNDINFARLPNQFVLKSTNGSGTVLICKDKEEFDTKKAKKKLRKWLKDDYSKEKKESQYKNIDNRIIVEEYMEDATGSLTDYKFYCFNGKVKYYGIFYDRYVNKTIDFYDKTGKKLNGVKTCDIPNSNRIQDFNSNIKEMIKLSEKLSEKFTHVRVDFYFVKSKIIFGELTFTDGAGSDPWSPLSFDLEIAKYLDLKRILIEGDNTK